MEGGRPLSLDFVLSDQNPWWSDPASRPPIPADLAKRGVDEELGQAAQRDTITALVGPRQVGKTTLMRRAICALLDSGVPSDHVLYANFDTVLLASSSADPISEVLEHFRRTVLRKEWRSAGSDVHVFLDEVHAADGWSSRLKGWYDLGLPIRFAISGSSSSDVLVGASESLTGRLTPHLILPLSFAEFASIRGPKEAPRWSAFASRLSEDLFGAGRVSTREFRGRFAEALTGTPRGRTGMETAFGLYLLRGGYPGILTQADDGVALATLKAIGDLTVYKDLVRFHNIRNPKGLDRLVMTLAHESSSIVSYESLSRDLGVNFRTLTDYIEFLESAWLFKRAPMYSRSARTVTRHRPKVHAVDPGIANAFREGLGMTPGSERWQSRSVESTVFEHMLRLQLRRGRISGPGPWYWRHGSQGPEVDVVASVSGILLPVEVKYARRVEECDMRGLRAFLDEHDEAPLGIVASRDTFEMTDDAAVMPAWFLALLA